MDTLSREPKIFASCPRFLLRSLPFVLGLLLTPSGAFLGVNMFLSIIGEESVGLIIASIVLGVLFSAMTAVGIISLLMAFETVTFSQKEVQIRLGKLVLRRVDVKNIRAVQATTREVRHNGIDQDVYLVKLCLYRGRPMWAQWSLSMNENLRKAAPDALYLM